MNTSKNNLEEELKSKNYKYLGWANGWKTEYYQQNGTTYFRYVDQPEHSQCISNNHNDLSADQHYNSVIHSPTGSNVTYYCDHCKIWWKVDMS